MKAEEFRQELRQLAGRHPLFQSTHPFWRDCFRGRLQIQDLQRWGRDVYPFVREFPRWYLHVAIKCESVTMLAHLAETIYEETGCGKESEAHSNLFKRFLYAIGLPESDIVPVAGTMQGKAFGDTVGGYAKDGSFLEGLTAVGLGVERPLPTFFPMVAKALQRHHGLSAFDVEFFSIHSVADVKHSQLAARIVSELADTDAKRQRVREIVASIWDQQQAHLDHLHSFVSREGSVAHAA